MSLKRFLNPKCILTSPVVLIDYGIEVVVLIYQVRLTDDDTVVDNAIPIVGVFAPNSANWLSLCRLAMGGHKLTSSAI